jgi:hypothetical protein
MLFNVIDLRVFLVALSVGLLYIYLSDDYKKVIILYPNPDNLDKYVYQDKANNCFSYELQETECPSKDSDYIKINANY